MDDIYEPEMVELDMYETRLVENPAMVDTGTLGPCVGMIIYNVRTQAAVATHMVEGWEVDEAVELAAREMPPTLDHEVYVGGASMFGRMDEFEKEFLEGSRRAVLEVLNKAGYKPEQLFIKFNDDHECASLQINTVDGEVSRSEW